MNANESNGQETSESINERRAEWEQFTMVVLGGAGGGYVNVRNDSHDNPNEHIHSVHVANGRADGCSCPHATYRDAHCKHQRAVEHRPLILSSATAVAADIPQIATDGGTQQVATTTTSDTQNDDKSDDKGTDCPECHAEGTVTYKPQPGSDTIPTFVCANCGYSTFTPTNAATTATATDDQQTDTTDDKSHPQTDQWGQPVEHYDEGPLGAGEQCECQSCGAARFEIALIAATAETSHQWEEFYECQNCGARGSFRVDETQPLREAQRSWTGHMAYPD